MINLELPRQYSHDESYLSRIVTYANFPKAEEPDKDKDLFSNNYYALFTVTEGELDCSSNAGRMKLRNRIEENDQSSDQIIPCQSE